MVAIDTNVLVRLLVDDPGNPAQCAMARKFVSSRQQVMIPEAVLLECVWVLQRLFGATRRKLGIMLAELMRNSRYRFERTAIATAAINLFAVASLDFGDCMIHAACEAAAAELVTFDKPLSKVAGVRLLTLKETP